MAVFVSIIAKQSLDDSLYETTKLLEQSQARAVAFARDTNGKDFFLADNELNRLTLPIICYHSQNLTLIKRTFLSKQIY